MPNNIAYVCLFCTDAGKPLLAGILNSNTGKTCTIPFYIRGSGLSIYEIERNIERFSLAIEKLLLRGDKVAISDFKSMLSAFPFPLVTERLEVYDLFVPKLKLPLEYDAAKQLLDKVLASMVKVKPKQWHNVSANASVAYQYLEQRGIYVGGILKHPQWSQHTFSGRSKSTGFNIQGASDDLEIWNPDGRQNDIFINFDWRGADIRVAALLSKDEKLLDISCNSDPYQSVADIINDGASNPLSRDECKLALLSAINALDTSAPILDIFPGLKKWIIESKQQLHADGCLFSILGRKFSLVGDRKDRSVLNATMQGSIAQAMQLAIRRVWEQLGGQLLADIHDSLVVTCPRNKESLLPVVKTVTDIMCNPFRDVLPDDPSFVVRVSVGSSWRKWKEYKVFHGT